jgi:hypothetical protein
MDASEVKEIAEGAAPAMKRNLALDDWAVHIEVDASIGQLANCTLNGRQKIARVTLNPQEQDDRGDVLNCLRHELLHCYDADFDACRDALRKVLVEGEYKMWSEFHDVACEHLNARHERMLDALGLTAENLAEDRQEK